MPILQGDIQLRASRVMDDVPEGGGGPTGTVIPYGGSNAVFGDVTETARAGGNVSIRQVHMGVLTPTTDALMGANVILSRLPTDPNVSVSLAKCSLFARRSEIAQAVASYLIQSVVWNGAQSRSLGYAHWPEQTASTWTALAKSRSLGYAHWPERVKRPIRWLCESRSLGYAHWPELGLGAHLLAPQSRSLGYAHWPELRSLGV